MKCFVSGFVSTVWHQSADLLLTMSHKAAEIATDDAVPSSTFLCIKLVRVSERYVSFGCVSYLALDMLSNVLDSS